MRDRSGVVGRWLLPVVIAAVCCGLSSGDHTATGFTVPSMTNGSLTRSASGNAVLRTGAKRSFARFAAKQPGNVEVAVEPLGSGQVVSLGGDSPAHGWSTTKVPVLAALLRARGSAGLTPIERQWAQLAITESDNQSILNLFGDLERLKGGLLGASRSVQRLLRRSGDEGTIVATAPPPPEAVTTFGQTEWAPGEAVKFFRALALGCLLPRPQTSYVLGLMRHIIPSESWGLGTAHFEARVAFKGGWGPEGSGYLVRQSGIIAPDSDRGVSVAIVTHSGAFSTGTKMVTATAEWLARELELQPTAGTGCNRSSVR